MSLGLTAYTYISARAVPILLLAFVLWQAIHERQKLRALASRYLLAFVVAALVFVPLGYTYLKDPSLFSARSGAVSLLDRPNAPIAIVRSAVGTLGMFSIAGDPSPRHNVFGRPVFDLVGSSFFLCGIVVAFRRWRQPAYAFSLLWLFVMLVPGMLSVDGPHFIRTLGAAPAAYMFMGLGIVTFGAVVKRWLATHWYALAVAIWFAILAFSSYEGYLLEWASSPEVSDAYEFQLSEVARYLGGVPPGPAVIMYPEGSAAAYPQVFEYMSGRSFKQVRWFDGGNTMLVPGGGEGQSEPANTVFVILGDNPLAERFVKTLPGVRLEAKREDRGMLLFSAYRVTEPTDPWQATYDRPLGLNVGNQALLEGYSVLDGGGERFASTAPYQAAVMPGGRLVLEMQWRVLGMAEVPDLRFFFHLVDSKGRRYAGTDITAYPSAEWDGGEHLRTWIELLVAKDTPPGRYEVQVGAYSFASQRRLAISDFQGAAVGNSVALGNVKIASEQQRLAPEWKVNAQLAEGPLLLGYDLRREASALRVILHWQRTYPIDRDYSVFLHLEDSYGQPIAQHDSQPAGGTMPTSYWASDEIVRDEHVVPLDPWLGTGTYLLTAGMYDPANGRRLAKLGGGDAVLLQEIKLP